jgi:hypothetical protein
MQDEVERDDTWAVNLMLDTIDEDFLDRHIIERPVTAYDLLRKLEQIAKPFRFLDLPREIRDEVYNLLKHLQSLTLKYQWHPEPDL